METDFSALRQALHAARLQAYGRDHTSTWVRIALDRLVDGVLRAQNGLPTASFAFLRQLSTPAYAVAFDTVSCSYMGSITVVQPLKDQVQGIAQVGHSIPRKEELPAADLDDVIKQAISAALAIAPVPFGSGGLNRGSYTPSDPHP